MKYQLWHSESQSSYALLSCQASSYEEALQKRNDYLGWGEYRSDGILFDYPPASDGPSSSQSRSGAGMIECLLRDAQEDFDVHVDILNRALRGLLRYAGDDGRWSVDASGNRFVYLSHEPPGLQVSFEETIDRERTERAVAEIIASLEAVTDKTFQAVWIS